MRRRPAGGKRWRGAPLARCLVLLLAVPPLSHADRAADEVRRRVAARDPELQVTGLEASPAAGLYLLSTPGVAGYVTADGRYFIVGDMFELGSGRNVSEARRRAGRRALLQGLDPRSAIVFPATRPKHSVVVFTDVDCPYCRKLHGEIARLNALGITVRYLAFPRAGPDTESWHRMEAVWCAKDRRAALGRALSAPDAPQARPCSGDVRAHHALAQALAAPGTPMLLLDDGTLLGGYLAPEQLLEELDRRAPAGATP